MHEDRGGYKNTSDRSDNDHEITLVLRVKQRDHDALTELIDLHSYTMLRLAAAITGSRDTAQDIVQDVFIALWTRAETLNIQGDVRSYLWAATRNHARMVLRHELVVKRHQDDSVVSALTSESKSTNLAVGTLDSEDILKQVNTALNDLPQRCREIFLLSWRDDLTYTEIAEALGIGVATVRNQVARAMRHIIATIRPEK